MSEREAWDQLPDESAKAFAAFCIYRDLPPDKRSLLEVSRQYYRSPDAKRPAGRITKWSADHKWPERATMRDAWREDLRRDAELAEEQKRAEVWAQRRIDIREEAWGLALGLIERAQEIMELPVTRKTEKEELVKEEVDAERGVIVQFITRNVVIEPLGIRARDSALIGRIAVEMARLAAGLSGHTPLTDEDLSKYSEDELRRIASGRPVARP